jgi:Xaa-Pro dipeptidase
MAELLERIAKLQGLMEPHGIDLALIVQRADLFYFSGTAQNAHLLVPVHGEPVLVVKKNLERARQESGLPRVEPFEGWSKLAAAVISMTGGTGKIGLELDVLPAAHYLRYQKLLAPHETADISNLIRQIRSVKSPAEIKLQQEAACLSKAVFTFAREIIREGMMEVELAAQLESFARSRGHQGAVRMRGFNQELFFGHVMAGESATVVSFFDGPTGGPGLNASYPQGAGGRVLGRNEPILIDYVTVLGGYMVDQTRIFCIGKLPPPLEEAYHTALKIREALGALGKPGTRCSELYQRAEELAGNAGLKNHFMGYTEKVRFIGHGVGIELDELPVIAHGVETVLEEGMVFALEPKFVFPGQGVVGVEDTFVVGKDSLVQITDFEDAL